MFNLNQALPFVLPLLISISYVSLLGCSSYSETKAPCNYEGTFCGTKMAINN